MSSNKSKTLISGLLVLAAVALLVPIYFAPIWWVSLEAPQYPEEAFPSGVRILFHMNGVFNGCEKVDKAEITEEEILDCVHEMDTINHYVGMYPIAAGGPVELTFSIFLMTLLGVMLLTFIFVNPKIRLMVMLVGFTALTAWMAMTLYSEGGLKYHNTHFLEGRVTVLGLEVEDDEPLSAGDAIIAQLKAALAESGEIEEELPKEEVCGKTATIEYLESAFNDYQKRHGVEPKEWKGNASQLLSWHYQKSLGRYFNDPAVLKPMVDRMSRTADILFWALIAIMVLFVVTARKARGFFSWLLVLIPITFPGLFILEYAAWLGWYGHNMSELGAFTLKPFMPTVFGQGKVAQFTTNSYPGIGFWLMVLFSALLLVAALMRFKQVQKEND